jgi:hypothetical protein
MSNSFAVGCGLQRVTGFLDQKERLFLVVTVNAKEEEEEEEEEAEVLAAGIPAQSFFRAWCSCIWICPCCEAPATAVYMHMGC